MPLSGRNKVICVFEKILKIIIKANIMNVPRTLHFLHSFKSVITSYDRYLLENNVIFKHSKLKIKLRKRISFSVLRNKKIILKI